MASLALLLSLVRRISNPKRASGMSYSATLLLLSRLFVCFASAGAIIYHLVGLLNTTIACDHILVSRSVASAIVGSLSDLRRLVTLMIKRSFLLAGHSLSVLNICLSRHGSSTSHATHTAHATAHRHLTEHTTAAEAATKATSKAATEEVIIIVEAHAKAGERVTPAVSTTTATLASATAHHTGEVIVEKVGKWVSASKESSEDVISLLEAESTTTSAKEMGATAAKSSSTTTLLEACLSVLIKYLSFLWVTQNGVCLTDLFENFTSLFLIVRVFILNRNQVVKKMSSFCTYGMPFYGKLAVSFFDRIVISVTVHSKNRVVVI